MDSSRPRRDWPARAATALALSALLLAVGLVVFPWLRAPNTFGLQDWDVAIAQRLLTRLSLRRFGQWPGWNPYACGGFPSWGYAEGAPTVISPWLPFYLVLPMPWAMRVEVLGMGLFGAIGAYVLAGRFTTNATARALVAVVWAANGRWALQIAAGHTWHLAFAWTPWCLYFYERARVAPWRAAPMGALALCFAMQLYAGGIYPLPHTVLALGLYALALAIAERNARPLGTLLLSGILALGLAAPKLIPVLVTFRQAPRFIASPEASSLALLWTALTSHNQGFFAQPAAVPAYGWHEWGMYIGVPALVLLAAGLCLMRDRRAVAMTVVGVVFLALGFGAVGTFAPWSLLHRLPVFRSHHVPARFQYTAVLLLAVAAASGLGRWLDRIAKTRPWSPPLAAALVALIAVDIASVARQPMSEAMVFSTPAIRWRERFHHVTSSPWRYEGPEHVWVGGLEYLAMSGNVGVLECYSAPPFGPLGAHAAGVRGFRGDSWIEGTGVTEITDWSPNRIVLTVRGASAGARVIYNGNAASGWSARITPSQGPTMDAMIVSPDGALGATVPSGDSTVVFTYRPPGLIAGTILAVLTMLFLFVAQRRQRRLGTDSGVLRPD